MRENERKTKSNYKHGMLRHSVSYITTYTIAFCATFSEGGRVLNRLYVAGYDVSVPRLIKP